MILLKDTVQHSSPMPRNRFVILLLLIAVIVLGLASRHWPALFPSFLDKYPGDALWTMAVYLTLAGCKLRYSPARLCGWALLISFLVEFQQLYQASWLVAIRHHPVGHLLLGSTFNEMDLLAYSVGAAMCLAIDWAWLRWHAS